MNIKLTDQHMQTCGGFQWGLGKRYRAKGRGTKLCSDGWLHYYEGNVELALMLNPIHAAFEKPGSCEG